MQTKSLFSEQHDYLLIAAAAGLTLWLFYGTVAAIGAVLVVATAANLQPLRRAGFSKNSSALLATAFILVLSIALKIFDREGYCYAFFGPQRSGVEAFGIIVPCFPGEDFYGNTGQPGGMGYARDFGLPIIGLAIGLAAVRPLFKGDNPSPSRNALIGIASALVVLVIAPPLIHVSGLGSVIEPTTSQTPEELERELERIAEGTE